MEKNIVFYILLFNTTRHLTFGLHKNSHYHEIGDGNQADKNDTRNVTCGVPVIAKE